MAEDQRRFSEGTSLSAGARILKSPAQRTGWSEKAPASESVWATVVIPCVLGAASLGFATLADDGSALFFIGTFIAAAVWWGTWLLYGDRKKRDVSCGDGETRVSVASRSSPGRTHLRRVVQASFAPYPSYRAGKELLRGFALGAALLLIFVIGALVSMRIPMLAAPVDALMNNVRVGGLALSALTTFINGVGEELYFRHVLPKSLEHRFINRGSKLEWRLGIVCVGIYALVTVAMGVALLVFAAICLGALVHYEARRSGGVVSSIAAHITWSLGMLFILPLLL